MQKQTEKSILGIGLDNKDNHKRITQSEKFVIIGGSQETHEKMTETVMKTFEELKRRGKKLEQTENKELVEIMHKNNPDN